MTRGIGFNGFGPQADARGGGAGGAAAGRIRKHRYQGVEEGGDVGEGEEARPEGVARLKQSDRRAATAGGKRQMWNTMLGCYAPCEVRGGRGKGRESEAELRAWVS